MDKDKRIIAYYIKDNLIYHVSSFKTSKEVYDALIKMFEEKYINQKMTLRNQLKNVKIQNAKTIQYYFTRVSLKVYEEVENVEIVMTTLNGLPRSWDSFSRDLC